MIPHDDITTALRRLHAACPEAFRGDMTVRQGVRSDAPPAQRCWATWCNATGFGSDPRGALLDLVERAREVAWCYQGECLDRAHAAEVAARASRREAEALAARAMALRTELTRGAGAAA
jgi:hypothetical protein